MTRKEALVYMHKDDRLVYNVVTSLSLIHIQMEIGENRDKKDRIIKDQSEFTILNEIYEGTVFADMIHDVNGERARIMYMNAYTAYSVHKDNSPRYHLALITNPNAYFIFPTLDEIIHIPDDGCLYEVDTTLLHSFVNCGTDRTHLVISKRS